MEKYEIEVNIDDFPKELHYIFEGANVYDSSCSPTAQVLYSDLGYYIKIAEKGKLEKDYMVTKSAQGEDSLDYLDNPEKLCKALADAMKLLHSLSIEGVPISPSMNAYVSLEQGQKLKKDTLIHGDFCLPNVIFDDWKFSSFIDLGLAGVGDTHIRE